MLVDAPVNADVVDMVDMGVVSEIATGRRADGECDPTNTFGPKKTIAER
jgi:hypothetical protein